MHSYRFGFFAALLLPYLLVGCTDPAAGNAGRVKVFKVSGKITLSGSPVANAMVSFSPKAKQPVAVGQTGTDGTYTLTTYEAGDGAAEGDYTVLVTKEIAAAGASSQPTGHDAKSATSFDSSAGHSAQSSGDAGGAAMGSSGLPAKYSSPTSSSLTATVKADGKNEKVDFDLQP